MRKSFVAILILMGSLVPAQIRLDYSLSLEYLILGDYVEFERAVFETDSGSIATRYIRYSYDQTKGEHVVTDFDADVVLPILGVEVFAGGYTRTYATTYEPDTSIFLNPYFIDWGARAGIRRGLWSLSFIHVCGHPMVHNPYMSALTMLKGEHSSNRVVLEFEGSIGG